MDSEKQKDEIIALKSIYNEEEFSYHEENGCYQCTFKIFISLPAEYYVSYKDTRHQEEIEQKVKISHLPPLSLNVTLPDDYPSNSPPKFTVHSTWLHQPLLTKICRKLDKLWMGNKGEEILFLWMAFLQDETLEFLNIQEKLKMDYIYTCYKRALEKPQSAQKNDAKKDTKKECTSISTEKKVKNQRKVNPRHLNKCNFLQKYYDKRAILEYQIGRNPIQALIDYNEIRNQIEFKKNFYTCKICFADKSGEHSTQFLPCTHVFCKECITNYLEVRIKEGTVQNIGCPEEKCTSEATPSQIKDLVSSELFAKYDSILLNATLDTMTDIVYCPRRNCQYPVSREPNEQMANCPVCQYAFCIYCKMVYHGIEPCKAHSEEKHQLVSDYQSASTDRKLILEQRYGKKQLQLLVDTSMSEVWIKGNTQKCPRCNAAIEKSDGCNKMTCWRCNTFFCWLCSTVLNASSPYEHFRNPQSKCFNMLYHGMVPEEEEDEDAEIFHFLDQFNYEFEDENMFEDYGIEF